MVSSGLPVNQDSGQGKPLFERIYALVRQIPEGKVTTYGEIARALGLRDVRRVGPTFAKASAGKWAVDPRVVGWALHANPYEGDVPCHRVVSKDGRIAPNFAFDGPDEQRRRLLDEGVEFRDELHVDLEKHGFLF